MPFRDTFDCLWCGRAHQTRGPDDLEGWAGLCPDCIGRAGENGFLRFRLRAAIEERARSTAAAARTGEGAVAAATPDGDLDDPDLDEEMRRYYAARAGEYDEVYLRRGSASIGPLQDVRFHGELDEVTLWLDRLPLRGEIVELAAGTGWWSPLLAQKGELSLYDANAEPLELARERLVAHGLRAHIHVRDAWEPPDRQVGAVFCGFWLSHVSRARLDEFLDLVRRWLRPGGRFAFVDEQAAAIQASVEAPRDERQPRRLADGREFTIRKVAYPAGELREALERNGFIEVDVRETAAHFVMGSATAAATAASTAMPGS